jgi:large subunit ribosomal protein L18
MAKKSRNKMRKRRHLRVRKKINGSTEVPRLNVYRSLRQLFVQVVDDSAGSTLVSVSTLEPKFRKELEGLSKIDQARKVGEEIARRAKANGIEQVVFDRGGYRYHGRVKAMAEAARQAGLQF